MPLTSRLALLPPDARVINDDLAIVEQDEQIVFFNAAGPIYACRQDDRTGVRLAAVTVIRQGLAQVAETSRALGLHRATLFRDLGKFEQGGVEALVAKRRGPRKAHKLTPAVRRRAQRLLDRGASITVTARSVGVSRRALYHAVDRGLLTVVDCDPALAVAAPADEALSIPGPSARAEQDQACEGGVAVKRTVERTLAAMGKLVEAQPEFRPAEAVAGAGVLLALPALLEQGLLDVGESVYGRLRNGYFGLRSIFLTFALMALLRIRTPEQLTGHAPGELGRLLGLDRVPEVKTLRRKLGELGARGLAHTFARTLTERWVEAEPRELALLYVDGHVRPYNGRTHTLPKLHVQQRGRPMPGTKDFHVNDRRAQPLLFVTAEATEGLLSMLDSTLLPEVRRLVGRRRVTITFDREGWSPRLFAKWKKEKFDVLTYRKGKQSRWQKRFFSLVQGRVGGRKVEYRLAERAVQLPNGLRVREIRRLTEDGHQTAVITTNETLPLLQVAYRMFSRWRQENFFRYMRHEFALDHLCTYEVEPADPKRLVTSPERAALQKKLKAARATRTKLMERRLDLVPGRNARGAGKRVVGEEELDELIRKREVEIEKLAAAVAVLPEKVPLDTVLEPEKIVKLERERKILVDAVKLTAYRAESSLARLVEPFFARHDDEARKFLKSIFQATADIIPDQRRHQLTLRFHGLANPRATRALADLCALMSERKVLYPGTDLRLRFEAPASQK